jgi:cell division protease FtsH
MKTETKGRWLFSIFYLVTMLGLFVILQLVFVRNPITDVSYNDFANEIRAGHIAEVQVGEIKYIGKFKSGVRKGNEPQSISTGRLPGIEERPLIEEMEKQNVHIYGRVQTPGWWTLLLPWLLPILLFVGIYGFSMRRMMTGRGSPLTFGRSGAKVQVESQPDRITFADVADVEEAKAELLEIVDFLKQPAKYQRLGGQIPKGVLLVGAPGTGKTLLARAVSGEAGVPFFSMSGSGFVEMFVGVGAARVRDLFEQAKLRAPCIVFIDELDAIGRTRTAGRAGLFANEEREQTLNQLLSEMDGFDSSKGVIIMAATNAPEVLDPALLRRGRFDRQITVAQPDLEGRRQILELHARRVKLSADADLNVIAARTPGMVGADLANIVNEAALLAVRREKDAVEMQDLEEAIDRVLLGLEKKRRVMSEEEKRRVAYHEAGHAIVGMSVEHAPPVHRASIIPRGISALGHTLQLPTEEKYLMTTPELKDQITIMLAGRAAEDLAFQGVLSTGAADDLKKASELARQMVTRFGMNERLGPLTYGREIVAPFLRSVEVERNYSEQTAQQIDEEVRRIIEDLQSRAREILSHKRDGMDRVAHALIERETLDRQQLDRLLKRAA